MTEVTTEMPRSRSMPIQSERVWRRLALARTSPASWMAPPNSSIFSVSVVLPASGCEMIAKVRRRATGFGSDIGVEVFGEEAGLSKCGAEGEGLDFGQAAHFGLGHQRSRARPASSSMPCTAFAAS